MATAVSDISSYISCDNGIINSSNRTRFPWTGRGASGFWYEISPHVANLLCWKRGKVLTYCSCFSSNTEYFNILVTLTKQSFPSQKLND